MELPTRRDLLALSLGHSLLALLACVALWGYVCVRLWRLHHPAARRRGGRPILQVRPRRIWAVARQPCGPHVHTRPTLPALEGPLGTAPPAGPESPCNSCRLSHAYARTHTHTLTHTHTHKHTYTHASPPQAAGSVCKWTLSAASLAARGAKLAALLAFELGLFPLGLGVWLDVCALPLSGATLDQRAEQLARSPALGCFVHFVMGVGFMLGLAFALCAARQVLRPGALPFIRVRGGSVL
jgi:hypothetical protein